MFCPMVQILSAIHVAIHVFTVNVHKPIEKQYKCRKDQVKVSCHYHAHIKVTEVSKMPTALLFTYAPFFPKNSDRECITPSPNKYKVVFRPGQVVKYNPKRSSAIIKVKSFRCETPI